MSGTRSRAQRAADRKDAKTMQVLTTALRDTTHSQPGTCSGCSPSPSPSGPAEAALVRAALAGPDPLPLLARMVEVRGLVGEVERVAVRQARADGASWATIGAALGVSGQAVAKKYGA